MAADMDAEDWRELVGVYLDEASKAVTQYGGHVLKKLGDGLMALFGYPSAQENDAERAARAGLAILRALEDLNAKTPRAACRRSPRASAFESGPVVVDSSGEVFGDAPNVAARVQAPPSPERLFVTAFVQRQVAGLFVAEDKGPHDLKGVPGSPALFRLVRASGGGRRRGARALTPLVGREEELATLARRWERARRPAKGSSCRSSASPASASRGSSRISAFASARRRTPGSNGRRRNCCRTRRCILSRNGGGNVSPARRELAGSRSGAGAGEARSGRICAAAGAAPRHSQSPDERAPQLAADELQRRQLAAVVAWLLAGARAQPLVLAFEDLHWADPTTLDLMKTLAERGGEAPLLIVATARPEFRAPWTTRSHHGVISLSPLDRAQIGQMVGAIAAQHALSQDVVEGVERPHRRRAAVHRGTDPACAGGRRADHPADAAAIARRAARPPRRSARSRADRRGARADVLARAARRGRRHCRTLRWRRR